MAPRKVLAIRHGQSVYNVLRAQYPSEEERYVDALFTPDCDVTELGVQQSQRAGRELRDLLLQAEQPVGKPLQVHVVVSPLRRALQTATHALSQVSHGIDNDKLLISTMVHPAATEVYRDACDIGTPVPQLRQEFPHLDMSFVQQACRNQDDGYWWGTRRYNVPESWRRMRQGLAMETDDQVQTRLQTLRSYIQDVDDADIVVVVCHSETIWWLSSKRGVDGDLYGIWSQNGEMVDLTEYILRLPMESGRSGSDPLDGGGLSDRHDPLGSP